MSLLNDASLVFIPSGYKEDKVYSVIPSNGAGDLDFVRGCDATRINPQALVENAPWNLLQNTNTLSQYGNTNATLTTNVTTSPIGTNDASKLMETASTSFDHYAYNVYFGYLSNTVTYSVYLKQNGRRYVQLATVSNQGVFRPIFDLQDGVYVSNAGTNTGATTNIENVGNGWFRCSVTHPSNTTDLNQITIILQNSAIYQSYTGDITKGIYCWGAQLNVGTLKPYFPTTDRLNVPRLTYENGCPSLLLEKQSTNLALYSEDYNNSYWTKDSTSLTSGFTSPAGTTNAFKLTELAANSTHSIYISFPSLSSSIYTTSIYVKKGERYKVALADRNTGVYVSFNLNTQSIIASSTLTGKIELINNDWYRISAITPNPYIVFVPQLFILENSYTTGLPILLPYTGDGTSGIYVWGAQFEASSYPTSYIPTTTATVTRLADSCYKTSISSLIGQTEGTVFLDFQLQTVGQDYVIGQIYNSSSPANSIYFYIDSSNYLHAYVDNSGTQVNILTASALPIGNYKIAIAYKQNDFVFYVNGTQIGTDTSGTVPTCNSINLIDYANGAGYMENSAVKQYLLFKRRLTNTELANLTTL